ncbi:MAG TPA: DUF4412 domain-containing protein [Gammaproteobacteria bacterium]|nr:DUF4412 domain-containing protein [Gammaproteobacteria bacterium]
MFSKPLATALGLALAGAAAPALADTHITFVDDKGEVAQQIYVKGGKVRVEGGQGQGVGVYDVAGNSMTVLMPAQKKYLVFNDASATQIGAGADSAAQQSQAANAQAQAALAQHQQEMDQANQQMETATANLTPEQKAMMQQMAATRAQTGVPMAGTQSGVVMKELGTTETVAGHSCKDVQMTVGGRPSATLCVISSPASLGIPAADLKTLQAMRTGMQKLMSQMGLMGKTMGAMMTGGFSLKTTRQTMQGLTPASETDTYKSLSTSSLSASLFDIPSGYTQTTMQELMQGGHR